MWAYFYKVKLFMVQCNTGDVWKMTRKEEEGVSLPGGFWSKDWILIKSPREILVSHAASI